MKYKTPYQKQKGSATLLVLLLVAGMLLLVEGVVSVVRVQHSTAQIHRQTSNTYDLLEESLEKFQGAVNQLLHNSSMELTKKLIDLLQETLFTSAGSSHEVDVHYKLLNYQEDKGFGVNNQWFTLKVMQYIFEILLEEYAVITNYEYRPKPISYKVQADRRDREYATLIEVVPYFARSKKTSIYSEWTEKEFINGIALKAVKGLAHYTPAQIANTYKDILRVSKRDQPSEAIGVEIRAKTRGSSNMTYDQESLRATLRFNKIDEIGHYLTEQYEWIDKPPNYLAHPIFCFNNIQIDEGAAIEKGQQEMIQVAVLGTQLEDYLHLESLEQLRDMQQSSPVGGGLIILEETGQVDISQLYRDEKPIPIVIIAKEGLELITTNPKYDTLRGIVIALDRLTIKDSMTVEGSILVEGICHIMGSGTILKAYSNPNVLWEIEFGEQKILRQVLDVLGLINLKAQTVEAIFKPNENRQYIKLRPYFDLVLEGLPLQISISQLRTIK